MKPSRLMVRWLPVVISLLFLAACNVNSPQPAVPETAPTLSVMNIGGTVTGNKTVADNELLCGESTTVTLTLDGQVSIAENPVDVMLVLDRSGSMQGTPLNNLKAAANKFVDLIEATNISLINLGITELSRVGVVSFSNTITVDVDLTDEFDDVRNAIGALNAGGQTALGGAIGVAQTALTSSLPSRSKVMIVVTDGVPVSDTANHVTTSTAAKDVGIEIFVIGFGNINEGILNQIASDPKEDHVFISPNPAGDDLEAAFDALGAAIIQPAGTNIQVVDTVNDNFTVSNAVTSKGNVAVAGNVLTWTIDELGTETVSLTYTITHDNAKPGGTQEVNTSVVYSDDEGKTVNFPSPSVDVRGCAANLVLTPKAEDNIVGEDHTVTATVTDDFGDPVSGITVNFSVAGGPSIVDGDPSNPMPSNGSDVTDSNGEATFTYTNSEASPDTITATAPFGQANVSVELSDTAEKTWLPVTVPIDVHPRSCPNPFNVTRRGVLPVAILGTADFDVTTVDVSKVRLEGIAPLRSSFEDVATPFVPYTGKTEREDCTTAGKDGYLDLMMHFDALSIAAAIAPVSDGEVIALQLTGEFLQNGIGYDFVGEDVVWIIKK